jgi:hypothetical protein
MFKKILPKSAIGQLYIGAFAIGTALCLTVGVTTTVLGAVLHSRG